MEVLRRLPGFPSLVRVPPGPGRYRFGRVEVLFQLAGADLAAHVLSSPNPVLPEVLRALDFFVQFGPQEFPKAAIEAVQSSDSMHLCPSTGIQDLGAPLTAPGLVRPPMSFGVPPAPVPLAPAPAVAPCTPGPLGMAQLGPPPGPPPAPPAPPVPLVVPPTTPNLGLGLAPAPVPMVPFACPKFGIDYDEI